MDFLHQGLLWLVPLAAIPIALHLFTLHRLKTIELSTFRFLFDSYVHQRRKIKLLEVILAALRTLFLLLLVLVVARPVVQPWSALFGGVAGREVIMIVDCSASMSARTAGKSSIERARSAAWAVAEQLSAEDRLTLVRLTTRAETVFSRYASDTPSIRKSIESLSTTPLRANIYTALGDLFTQAAFRTPGQTVYLFTDGQASGWSELKDQGLGVVVPADSRIFVVNVGSNQPVANRAVVGTVPRETRIVAGLPVILRPQVVNFSRENPSDVTVRVLSDGQEIDRIAMRLKPGESASHEFTYTAHKPGVEHLRFEIEGDSFPDDDVFLFTLHVVPAVRVLVVNGVPNKDPLENEALFLVTALQARSDRPREVPFVTGGSPESQVGETELMRSLEVQEVVEPQLTQSLLDEASVVFLANAGSLNVQQFLRIREFVASGGGLVIWPGDKVNPDLYSNQFFAAPSAAATSVSIPAGTMASQFAAEPLVNGRLGAAVGDLEQVGVSEKLTTIDFAHPVFSAFESGNSRYLATARFWRRFPIELGQDRSKTWPIAQFGNGQPAFVECRFGHGIVLLASVPASARWSNLPLKPEFVPLVLRMASYVMRRGDIEAPSVVAPGAAAEVAVALPWAQVSGRVTDPKRRTTPISFQRADGRLVGSFENTIERGYYLVEVSGEPADHRRRGSRAFAVNLSPEESDFAMINPQLVANWLPGTKVQWIDASSEAQETLGQISSERREIWRPLIAIMFLIIAIEFLLSTLRATPDRDTPSIAQRMRRHFAVLSRSES